MQIGPYEVLGELGRGSAGVVYRARGPTGAHVAVKVLIGSTPAALVRFDRERRLLASLDERDGFVPLLDQGEAGGRPYLVLRFVPGGTLRDRLRLGAIGVDETLALGRALASAMARAHSAGIVHRDLKPENVLFAPSAGAADGDPGRPLVADLGLAKHFHSDAPGASQSRSLTRTGELHGTFGYMAPEQSRDAREATPAADVFSIGAILYECLAGEGPFARPTAFESLVAAADGKLVPLRERRPDAPPWLAATIERCLVPEPEERFASGAALLEALDEGEARTAPAARPGRGTLVLAALLGLGLAGGAALLVARPRPGPSPSPSRLATAPDRPASSPATSPGSLPSPDRQRLRQLLQEGQALRARHEFAHALELADAALRLAPDEPMALALRGTTRGNLGDPAGGLADLEKAIDREPASALFLTWRGTLLASTGENDRALVDLDKAIALDPRNANALAVRATCYGRRKDNVRALADAERALAIDPDSKLALLERAGIRARSGNPGLAVDDLSRILALDPTNPIAIENRSVARFLLGDLDGALEDTDRALAMAPRSATLLLRRSTIRLRQNDPAAALRDADAGLAVEPDDASLLMARAGALDTLGRTDEAIADLARAIVVGPEELGAWLNLARLHEKKGDIEAAIHDSEAFLERAPPDDPRAKGARDHVGELRARR